MEQVHSLLREVLQNQKGYSTRLEALERTFGAQRGPQRPELRLLNVGSSSDGATNYQQQHLGDEQHSPAARGVQSTHLVRQRAGVQLELWRRDRASEAAAHCRQTEASRGLQRPGIVRHSAMKEGGVLVYSAMLDGVRCPAGSGWDEQLSTSLAAHRRSIPADARKPTSLQPSSLYKCVEYVSANDHDLTLSSSLYNAADIFRGLRHTPARRIEAFQQRVLTNELMVWFETNGPSSTLPHMDMTGGISSMVREKGRKLIGWWDLADNALLDIRAGVPCRWMNTGDATLSLSQLLLCPSFHWFIVSTSQAMSIPPDTPHFVFTLEASRMIGCCLHISPWRSIRVLVYAITGKVHDTFFATTSDTTLSANTCAIYSDFLTHIHQHLNDDIITIRQGKHELYRDIRTYTALWPSNR